MTSPAATFFVHDQGVQIGPLPMEEIATRWKSGQITRDALYCADGWPSWKPLIASEEMAVFFRPPRYKSFGGKFWKHILWAFLIAGAVTLYGLFGTYRGWPMLSDLPPVGPLLIFAVIYFLPTLMASKSEWVGWIALLNLLFGWTVVVWIACIIAAIVSPKRTQ